MATTENPLLGSDAASSSTMSSLLGMYNSAKEKWDASGANEAVGRVSANIPESTKQYVGQVFNREHLRGPTVYFGFGEERPFYIEKNPSLLVERLRHNVTFFYLNYLLLTGVLFCLSTLLSPTTLVGVALLAAVWMWMIRASTDGNLVIGSIQIPQKTAMLVLSVASAFFLFWLFQGIFWWTIFSSGFLVALHAFLRDASMHKDLDDVMAMEGDLGGVVGGEDASFLNSSNV